MQKYQQKLQRNSWYWARLPTDNVRNCEDCSPINYEVSPAKIGLGIWDWFDIDYFPGETRAGPGELQQLWVRPRTEGRWVQTSAQGRRGKVGDAQGPGLRSWTQSNGCWPIIKFSSFTYPIWISIFWCSSQNCYSICIVIVILLWTHGPMEHRWILVVLPEIKHFLWYFWNPFKCTFIFAVVIELRSQPELEPCTLIGRYDFVISIRASRFFRVLSKLRDSAWYGVRCPTVPTLPSPPIMFLSHQSIPQCLIKCTLWIQVNAIYLWIVYHRAQIWDAPCNRLRSASKFGFQIDEMLKTGKGRLPAQQLSHFTAVVHLGVG